jgi:hypothetical protein
MSVTVNPMSAAAPAARARDMGSTVTSDSFGVSNSSIQTPKFLAAAEGLADRQSQSQCSRH